MSAEYGNTIIFYETLTEEQLADIRAILFPCRLVAEFRNTFFIKTESSEQENTINDSLKQLGLTYIFAHSEYLDGTYVDGNVPENKLSEIRMVFIGD